jgi:hypothetical protein
MRLAPQAQTVQVVSHSALPPIAEPAEIDRLVSASIGGGQPIYRLDTDAIRDLRPDRLVVAGSVRGLRGSVRARERGTGGLGLPGRGGLPGS